MKSVVVTGASSGIGYAIAADLLSKGYQVFGSVRSELDGQNCVSKLGSHFIPLIFDVTDEAAVRREAQRVRDAISPQRLSGLVNNAGIAVPGPMVHLPINEFRRQLEVNVTGQLIVTQAFAPLLGMDKTLQGAPGKIINISSVAGKMTNPFTGAYSASKHALEAISTSLRIELLLYGIDVVVVGPGAVRTPIWEKADKVDLSAYATSDYGPFLDKVRKFMLSRGANGLDPSDIATCVGKILEGSAGRTRYSLVKNKFSNWTLPRLLPDRMLDGIIAKRLGLKTEN